jgi:hypothetical protein
MPQPESQSTPPRRTRVLVAVIISVVVIAFIVVHLTGVIGPG